MAMTWMRNRTDGPTSAHRRTLLRLGVALPIWQPWTCARTGSAGTSTAFANELDVLTVGADPTGRSDSSAAFRRAIEASRAVFVPAGRFVIGDVALRSGLSLRGEGQRSELLQSADSRYGLWCDSGSPVVADNLQGLRIRDLHLRGRCDVDGFSEHRHLLNLNGVSDCVVERVGLTGFRGDGIYLGSSNRGRTERHNRNVKILECAFDGVDHRNRNAVSIVDCDGLTIDACSFRRVSRRDMPGAIDLEPDANAFHVVRNARITNNRFADIGGSVGVVSVVVPTRLTTPVEGVVINRNEIRGARRAAFCLLQRGDVDEASRPRGLEISDNTVLAGADRPFQIEGVNQTRIAGNRFIACDRSALVGYAPPALPVTDLALIGNRFEQCGSKDSAGLRIYQLVGGRFQDNEWVDCGDGSPGAAAVELTGGHSAWLDFEDNSFSAPLGRTRYAIRRSLAHRVSGAPSRFRGNRVGAGMLNQLSEGTAS